MALWKETELPSGVTVRYHRVVSLHCITNVANLIEVASYTSAEKREEEKAAIAAGEAMDVFLETTMHDIAYDQDMTIEGAYAYLKSLSDFDGAEDLIEQEVKT